MTGNTTSSPSDAGPEAADVNVTDVDELREFLLALAEDAEAGDLEAIESRGLAIVANARRQQGGGHGE